jgi:hypothetical protein
MKKSRLSYERHHQWRALGRWLHLRDRASSSSCPPVVAGLLLLQAAVHLPSLPPQSGLTVNPNSGEKSDRSSMTVHLLSSPNNNNNNIHSLFFYFLFGNSWKNADNSIHRREIGKQFGTSRVSRHMSAQVDIAVHCPSNNNNKMAHFSSGGFYDLIFLSR